MDSIAKEDKTSEAVYFWPQGQDSITAANVEEGDKTWLVDDMNN